MSEITQEEYEALKAQLAEANDKASRIEQNKNDILNEYKAYKQTAAEKEAELEQQRIDQLREKGEEAEALKAEMERSLRLAEQKAGEAEMFMNKTLSSENKAATNSILSMFVDKDDDMAVIASQFTKTEYDTDKGEFVTLFLDRSGNVVSNDVNEWRKNWAEKDPAMQKRLTGSKASGFDTSSVKPTNTNKQAGAIDLNAKAAEINAKYGVR